MYSKNRIIVFGSGEIGVKCINYINDRGYNIQTVFDNDSTKWGGDICGVSISEPCFIKDESIIIVVGTIKYSCEIYMQLKELGYSDEQIISEYELFNFFCMENKKDEIDTPFELQFPITYKCNMDCIMCGMREQIGRYELKPEEIKKILDDSLFEEIKSVGVNGGEPFLREDFEQCISAVIDSLPNLSDIYIISNGYYCEKITGKLERVKPRCEEADVKLHLSLSIDGIGEVHDKNRCLPGSFTKVMETYDVLSKSLSRYADDIDVICTITKNNISRIYEVDEWAKDNGITVNYNIATRNDRLTNQKKEHDFSIFSDPMSCKLTQEFMYQKYYETRNERYYALFLYALDGKRYSQCVYGNMGGITLFPDGDIGFCAVRSKRIGSLQKGEKEGKKLIGESMDELMRIKEFCNGCGQYIRDLDLKGKEMLHREIFENEVMRW